jgi:hypothetical protein
VRTFAAVALACLAVSACDAPRSDEEEAAIRAVTLTLVAPDTAKFKNVQVCRADNSIIMGDVSSMNRLGVQLAFEPFFVEGYTAAFAGDPLFTLLMDRCFDTNYSDELSGLPAAGSQWRSTSDTNPLDDSKTIIASIAADAQEAPLRNNVTLMIRCQSNKTELYVDWNDYLGDDSRDVYSDWKRVTVRVGDLPARQQRWGISTDSEATFAPASAIGLIRQMVNEDRLVLQTTPYNESPVTAVFNLEGMRDAVEPIAEECNWQL